MSCCGKKRENYVQPAASPLSQKANNPEPAKMPPNVNDVRFEYTGDTALTVTGYVTGKRYRFSRGDIQLVDYRDAGSMMTVPVLKKVL